MKATAQFDEAIARLQALGQSESDIARRLGLSRVASGQTIRTSIRSSKARYRARARTLRKEVRSLASTKRRHYMQLRRVYRRKQAGKTWQKIQKEMKLSRRTLERYRREINQPSSMAKFFLHATHV